MFALLVIALTVLLGDVGSCAKILAIVPTPSYSHQVVFQPLFRELSLRGHHVTVLTTDPVKDPKLTNLTEIDLHFSYKIWNEHIMKNALAFNSNPIGAIWDFVESTIEIQDEQLSHPSVKALIEGDEKFDIVLIEMMMPAMFAFFERFKCPSVVLISMEVPSNWYKMMGNPTHPIVYPDSLFPLDRHLTFLQRLGQVVLTHLFYIFMDYVSSIQEGLVKTHFGEGYPRINDILNNIDLMLINTDPIFHQVRPLVPTIIQIGGGTHIKPQKPLPSDLKEVVDNAKNGFVYFSLGTNVKSKDVPLEIRNVILQTFSELPFTILWKFETDDLPNKPENVKISSWFPQQDIMRHPNIKLFITQAGLQSMEEAIYSGVPMVAMPFFADQATNAKKIELKGMGLVVQYATLTKEEFKSAILEVAQNSRYRSRVKELANLARDQPMTGLERAVWWTEYAIRHNGTAHLRSPLLDIPWYQYLLLDVLATILGVCLVSFYLFCAIVRYCLRCFKRLGRSNEKKVQ